MRGSRAGGWELAAWPPAWDRPRGQVAGVAGRQRAGQPSAGGHGGGAGSARGDAALVGGTARPEPEPRGHVSRRSPVDSRGEDPSYT